MKKYKSLGIEVCLSKNYAKHLGILDDDYLREGAEILENDTDVLSKSSVIVQVNLIEDSKLIKLNKDQSLIGILNPYSNKEKIKKLTDNNINCFSLELLPRITRAQAMDILSSQANLAGIKR